MREILFRGKRKVCDELVYGFPFISRNGEYKIKWYDGYYGSSKTSEIYPESIGQFTGLTDKNGEKIFEGDVVKFTDSPFGYSYTGVVCFNEGSFCIKYEYWEKEKFHRIGQTDKWRDMGASGIVTYQYEILGNIHDNPELLENP